MADQGDNTLAAKRQFQTMWVGGTLGAFFTALIRNAPVHFLQISASPDWQYTLDLAIRYLYLFWLLAYFFISNLRNSLAATLTDWDIPYDVVQSVLSLVAVFCLGFIVTGAGFPIGAYRGAAGAADIAIFAICVLALRWFPTPKDSKVRLLRIVGSVLSLTSLLLVIFMGPSRLLLGLVAALLAGLWIDLAIFIHHRLTTA